MIGGFSIKVREVAHCSVDSRLVKVAQRTDLALTRVEKGSFQRHSDVEELRDDLSI